MATCLSTVDLFRRRNYPRPKTVDVMVNRAARKQHVTGSCCLRHVDVLDDGQPCAPLAPATRKVTTNTASRNAEAALANTLSSNMANRTRLARAKASGTPGSTRSTSFSFKPQSRAAGKRTRNAGRSTAQMSSSNGQLSMWPRGWLKNQYATVAVGKRTINKAPTYFNDKPMRNNAPTMGTLRLLRPRSRDSSDVDFVVDFLVRSAGNAGAVAALSSTSLSPSSGQG
mmetsp:Transcript_91097/g.262671  ORF Transcript_91097/g.262671 Transcript_91097/m.262671 type:complete len:227 (-) Transcript_91097:415-1095(-)